MIAKRTCPVILCRLELTRSGWNWQDLAGTGWNTHSGHNHPWEPTTFIFRAIYMGNPSKIPYIFYCSILPKMGNLMTRVVKPGEQQGTRTYLVRISHVLRGLKPFIFPWVKRGPKDWSNNTILYQLKATMPVLIWRQNAYEQQWITNEL